MKRFLVEVEKMIPGGDAISYYNGKAVFIDGGVPGDRLEVEVVNEKKDYISTRIRKIIEPSEARTEPRCPYFPRCGGCQWQMVDYKWQLKFKKDIILDAFRRIGKIEQVPIADVIGMENPWHFRNKAQYPLKRVKNRVLIGYYEEGTHFIVDIDSCLVQLKQFDPVLRGFKKLLQREPLTIYNEEKHYGKLRHFVLRGSENTGETLVVLVVKETAIVKSFAEKILALDPERIIGVVENINPKRTNVIYGPRTRKVLGRPYYMEKVLGHSFRVSALSFFQVNVRQVTRLIEKMREVLREDYDTIIDAYAGVGLFALSMADRAKRVIGIEESTSSVKDAHENVSINNQFNVEYFEGKVENILPTLERPDLILLDPPRKGLEKEVIDFIIDKRPPEVAYVSCNPVTLARDMRILVEYYDIELMQPYDFFPHTHHVETLVILKGKGF